jgi:putative transposase
MARLPRLTQADQPHLLLLRGHNGQPICLDDADRADWCAQLREASLNAGVDIHAWVLLDSALQLLATPRGRADALGELMQSLGRRYVAGFNRRHGRRGTLWEGRYRTALVEPGEPALQAVVALETAPQRTGLVTDATAWPWSSLAHHLGRRRDPLVTDLPAWWALGNTPFDREAAWRRRCDEGLPASTLSGLDAAVQRGWPWGGARFKAQVAEQLGRPVEPRPRGRPARMHHPDSGPNKKTTKPHSDG